MKIVYSALVRLSVSELRGLGAGESVADEERALLEYTAFGGLFL